MATKKARPTPAASHVVLFTGFPGFIGARLIPRLLELKPDSVFHCLVQEKFLDLARSSVEQLAETHPGTKGRIELVTGDITAPGLGIGETEARVLHRKLTGCYHLAAVYDLAVKRDVAMRINVEGTRNVLGFLEECPHLNRFDYVSTAYVSGTAVGTYRETDLDVGQSFKNYYEETKFLAEEAVKGSALPTATYRPAIVVGDSRTGETAKFDGPYFALNAMRQLPSPGVFVKVGPGTAPVNLVPVDYVLEAIARLSTWEGCDREDLPPDRPEPPLRLRDRGALREGDRQAVPLRPGADRPRQAPLLAEAGPGLLRHARRDGRVLRPPGAVRQLAWRPRTSRRSASRARPSPTTSRTSSPSTASTSRRSRGGR